MNVSLYTKNLKDVPAQLVSLGAFSDDTERGPAFAALNESFDGLLAKACEEEEFKAKPGQQVVVTLPVGSSIRRVVLYGLGARSKYTSEMARRFGGDVVKVANKVGAKAMAVHLPGGTTDVTAQDGLVALSEGLLLGSYRFTPYLAEKGRTPSVESIYLAYSDAEVNEAQLNARLGRVRAAVSGVNHARDLVNMPANKLYPAKMAEFAEELAKKHDLGCKILNVADLEKENMQLHLGVGQGADHEPKLIHLTYTPKKKTSDRVIALVGKGLTFDAGGLSLKPADGMMTMKIDMGGAAAVLGAMDAIAQSQPGCVVHGIVGAAENMPDGRAIRPGDVITGKKGISVEILNTDAEGRLVLADALAYAQDQKPSEIVNLATLTGACMIALGPLTGGAFIRDEDLHGRLSKAWAQSGEKFWRMPLQTELREQLESDIADIKNIGERWGGSITAGLFLSEFVDDSVPWGHLDVAGPVFSAKPRGYIPKGGTGYAVRTLVEYIHLSAETSEN